MTRSFPRWIVLATICGFTAVASVPPTASAGHEYEQSVWFTWDTTELDVLVLGVEDPVVGAAIREAIEAWQAGIAELAPDWLADAHVIRPYFPAFDGTPPPGFEPDDIEIFFTPAGFMAVQEPYTDLALGQVCYAFAPVGYVGPNPLDLNELYFTAAHEFGHCLGLTHVFEHGVEYDPPFDLLGGGSVHATYGKSCPSNLNSQVLERVYGALFSKPSGGTVTIDSNVYMQATC